LKILKAWTFIKVGDNLMINTLIKQISVQPSRNGALEELEKYRDKAVLCKLMPSAHWIDLDYPVAHQKLERSPKRDM
jgi:hypothetical protein